MLSETKYSSASQGVRPHLKHTAQDAMSRSCVGRTRLPFKKEHSSRLKVPPVFVSVFPLQRGPDHRNIAPHFFYELFVYAPFFVPLSFLFFPWFVSENKLACCDISRGRKKKTVFLSPPFLPNSCLSADPGVVERRPTRVAPARHVLRARVNHAELSGLPEIIAERLAVPFPAALMWPAAGLAAGRRDAACLPADSMEHFSDFGGHSFLYFSRQNNSSLSALPSF